jgi:crossover junction endodeoxyribonuclease RusA
MNDKDKQGLIKFNIIGMLSTNKIWRAVDGGVKLSDDARKYYSSIRKQISDLNLNIETIDYLVDVKLVLHHGRFKDTKSYDVDNYSKALFDGFTKAGLWVDDCLVKGMSVSKSEKIKGGLIEVEITRHEEK